MMDTIKKKLTKKQIKVLAEDDILNSLKCRYFKLLEKENIPQTKEISKKLDALEETIKARKEELL